jgi:hypothetical protein
MREKRGKMKLRTVEEFLSIFKTERKLALKVKLAMEDLLFMIDPLS